jgi:transcriptional regulator with XRE-family HTH domain
MADTPSPRTLGAHLRSLRKKAKFSLKTAARALGVSVMQLHDIEADKSIQARSC